MEYNNTMGTKGNILEVIRELNKLKEQLAKADKSKTKSPKLPETKED